MAKSLVNCLPFFAALALGLFAALPLAQSVFFVSHDGPIHVMRQAVWHEELVSGQIPPRWAGHLLFNYGYPLFIFLYPLPLWIGELFVLSGFSVPDATKLVFALMTILYSIGMFLWGRKLWGVMGGLVSSVAYTFFPYHAVELYVRGSIGEVTALGLFPFLMWSMENFFLQKTFGWWLISIGLLSALILSHNILAAIFVPVVVAYVLIRCRFAKKELLLALGILFFSLGLTAWFWLPALYEKQFTILDRAIAANFNFRDHFITLTQLLIYSPWGYGGSKPGSVDGMSFLIPKEFLFSLLLILVLTILHLRKLDRNRWQVWFWLGVGVISAFFTLEWSRPIWEAISSFALIQYPWRWLAIVMIALSIVLGGLSRYGVWRKYPWLACIIISLLIGRNAVYIRTGPGGGRDGQELITNEKILNSSTTYADEHLPIWVLDKPKGLPDQKVDLVNGKGTVKIEEDLGTRTIASLVLTQPSIVRIHTFYFPGWNVKVDNIKIPIQFGRPYGTIDVSVPKGTHKLVAQFQDTMDRRIGMAVSLLTLGGIGWLWRKRYL